MDPSAPRMQATRASSQRRRQLWLVTIELAIAVSATGGGIYGLSGAKGVSRSWLEGSPFHSYLVPSLILVVVVAGSMLAALVAELARYPRAAEVSGAAGLVLLGWLAAEVPVIPFSWLHPTFALLGTLVGTLASPQWFER